MRTWIAAVVEGFVTIFSLGTYRDPRVNEILNRPDADALRGDWEAVAKDFERVMKVDRP